MWVGRELWATVSAMALDAAKVRGELAAVTAERDKLLMTQDWFKHRLNQVEQERGQLIQAAIGVKVNIPRFVPSEPNPDEALNRMPDLSTVGGDARGDAVALDGEIAPDTLDYSLLPGYKSPRVR